MNVVTRGLVLGGLHIAGVLSLGGKLLIDRATSPRVWARTAPFDPNLPIRGRYVRLRIEAEARGLISNGGWQLILLSGEDGRLIARAATSGQMANLSQAGDQWTARLTEPLAFFIPEQVPDPSRRPPGEELWVEVTLPPKGPPRPIRLGVKKDGVLTPLP